MKNSLRAFSSVVRCCAILVCVVLLGAFFVINWAPSVLAQATNPSYIGEFPSVDKVMAAEKVADPDQTAAQQMAAFTQLMNMILQAAGPRQFMSGPNGMTQDEQNLRQAYNTALYNIQKSNPKYANPLAMKSLNFSQTFRNQMIQQLFPPNFQAEFTKAVAAATQAQAAIHQQAVQVGQAQQKAAQPAEQQALAQLQQQVQQQQQEANMDPATREMRRCVSSGRVAAVCTGNALSSSLLGGVNGLLSSLAPGTVGKEVTGPQMAGVFTGGGGWRLEFSEASVALSCQDLSPDSHAYTISFVNNRAVLDIAAMPKDVMLTVTGDTLSGTIPVTVQGRIYDGASDKTTGGKTTTTYKYTEVTRNCVKPVLSKSNSPGVVGAEQNLLVSMFNDGQSGPPTPAGLRMNGSFAAPSTGFSVEFFPESVILGCGPDAARAYPYTVVADGSKVAIQVAAPDHPLTLAWKGNNTLDPGTGPYVVEGRRVTGQDANDDFTFAAMNMTCNLAMLTPGPIPSMTPAQPGAPAVSPLVGAAAGGPAASAPGARPASAPAAPPPAPAPADPFAALSSVAIPAAAPGGSASLSIYNNLTGAPSPLAGKRFVLLRDDLNNVIAKSGAAMPPGASPVTTMSNDCAKSTPDCQKILNAIQAASVASMANSSGMPRLFVAPGTYYVVVSAPVSNKMLYWDVKVVLQDGNNSVMLTTQNAAQ